MAMVTAGEVLPSDDIGGYPIQLAKVQPPVLRDETLERPRLLDWLRVKVRGRVVLLLADAGYGKTTLLVRWEVGPMFFGQSLSLLTACAVLDARPFFEILNTVNASILLWHKSLAPHRSTCLKQPSSSSRLVLMVLISIWVVPTKTLKNLEQEQF